MKTKETLAALSAFLGLTLFAGGMDVGERIVAQGANPAFSPDGRRIAFQRLEGEVFKIGVVALDGGDVEWVENGPGNAAYPEWTPSGGLVYMAGHDTETAYEAWKANSGNGYGLWLWENGVKRRLTSGRGRDYAPCVSPDGKKVYFVTTRGVVSESEAYSKAAAPRIAEIDLDGGEPRMLMDSPTGDNSGFVQPAVSPDGSLLVWGHLESFFDTWRIYGTRMGRFGKQEWCPVSPRDLAAISPRWHPDGKIICFSGFRKGDPGWGVWVEEIKTGKVKRLSSGENPCFSPDGKYIAYDRGGTICIRRFGAGDMPDEAMSGLYADDAHEKVLWTAENVTKETSFAIDSPDFAFGDDMVFFVRLKAKLDGTPGFRQLLVGDYAEDPLGIQVHADRDMWFSTHDRTGRFTGACDKKQRAPGEYAWTGIRTPTRLILSRDGSYPAVAMPRAELLPLDHLRRITVGKGLKPGESVVKVEVGSGWPTDVPRPKKREDLFKRRMEWEKGMAKAAFLAVAAMVACGGRGATRHAQPPAANSFDVVALVDSLDFAKNYDIETATGTVQVLEHVLLTHASDIWWRDKSGGRMRYPSRCEMWPVSEAPFDKKRLPGEDIYGYLRLESPRGNEFPTVREECARRGLGFGIHTTIEENHWRSTFASNWTLAHPEYWGCTRSGIPWMGSCSIMHPEVVAHKLEMVDERLSMKPQKIMLDFWRNGSWTYAREYTAPALAEWKRLHGGEPVPDATDPRWQKMVGAHFDDYLRRFSAKCRAVGVEFIVGVPYVDDRDDAALRSRYNGFAWRHLAKEGVLDAVYVMGVAYDRNDPFGSTERIYRDVMANCGKAKVYFPVSSYNMQQCGIEEYAKLANISDAEATKRLVLLARKVGARGVVLECVDYMNYSPAMCAAIDESIR